MNSSATSRVQETPFEYELFAFLGGRLDSSTTEAYVVLLFIAIMNKITCPVTTVLNALVLFVVATKQRLQTMSNLAVGCLATTDGMMGVIGQPLFIVWIVTVLQGEANCIKRELSASAVRILGTASLIHMALMNVERYIAIKHSFAYITVVNKSRILCSSVIIWIGAIIITIPLSITNFNIYLIVNNITLSLCITIIFYCQVVIYFEIRRHEKEIAAQQVSVEARQKFLKEKKTFELTTTIVFFILTYSPIIVVRMLITRSVIDSVNVTYIAIYTAIFLVILNSLLNPVIYCVRLRQFRVAFIEVVFRKSNAQAEEIEMLVFGTLNACEQHEERQESEGRQHNELGNLENTGNNISNNSNNNSNNNNSNNSQVNNNHNSNIDDNDINNNSNSNVNNENDKDNDNNNNAFLNKQLHM